VFQVKRFESAWFAPRVSRSVTRPVWRRRSLGVRFFGDFLFWVVLFYLWAGYKVLQAAVWLVVLALVWAAQLPVLLGIGLYALGELAVNACSRSRPCSA
jgi:hypothetical protein